MKRAVLIITARTKKNPDFRDIPGVDGDALEVHAFFRSAGYDLVRILRDPSRSEIENDLRGLRDQLSRGDLLVIYFAGHGHFVNGHNILLCPDARLDTLPHFTEAVPVDYLRVETSDRGLHRLLILDCCRDTLYQVRHRGGPKGLDGARSLRDVGAVPVGPGGGSFHVLWGCSQGEVAPEIPALNRGLFTTALLETFAACITRDGQVAVTDRVFEAVVQRMTDLTAEHRLPCSASPERSGNGTSPVVVQKLGFVMPAASDLREFPAQAMRREEARQEREAAARREKRRQSSAFPTGGQTKVSPAGSPVATRTKRIKLPRAILWIFAIQACLALAMAYNARKTFSGDGETLLVGEGFGILYVALSILSAMGFRKAWLALRRKTSFGKSAVAGLLICATIFVVAATRLEMLVVHFDEVMAVDLQDNVTYAKVTDALSHRDAPSRQVVADARAYLASAGSYSALVHHDQNVRHDLNDYEDAAFDAEYQALQSFAAERQSASNASERLSHRMDFIDFWKPVVDRHRAETNSSRVQNYDEVNRVLQWDQTLIEVVKLKANPTVESLDLAAKKIDDYLATHPTPPTERSSATNPEGIRDKLRADANEASMNGLEQANTAARAAFGAGAGDDEASEANVCRMAVEFSRRPGVLIPMGQRAAAILSESADRWDRTMYAALKKADADARGATMAIDKGAKFDAAITAANKYVASSCSVKHMREVAAGYAQWFDDQQDRTYQVTVVSAEVPFGGTNGHLGTTVEVFLDVGLPDGKSDTGNKTNRYSVASLTPINEKLDMHHVTWRAKRTLIAKSVQHDLIPYHDRWFAKVYTIDDIGSALNGRVEVPFGLIGNAQLSIYLNITCREALPPELPDFPQQGAK